MLPEFTIDITVSVPSMVRVNEGDGTVQICAMLSSIEDTQRNFSINMATREISGIYNIHKLTC